MKARKLRWRFYKKKGGPRGIGNRCAVYLSGCIVCESYRLFYETGRFPAFYEIKDRKAVINDDGQWEWLPWSAIQSPSTTHDWRVR